MQVGYLGLMKAIPQSGSSLRARAASVRGAVHHRGDQAALSRQAIADPGTRPLQELLLEQRGAMEDLTDELERSPLESEVAGRLGVTPEELREARRAGRLQRTVSRCFRGPR